MKIDIRKKTVIILAVVFLLPTSLFYGFIASLGTIGGGGSIAIKIINGQLGSIANDDVFMFSAGLGGLIGIIGFWSYFIWRIRSPRRAGVSAIVIPLSILIGVISALAILLPAQYLFFSLGHDTHLITGAYSPLIPMIAFGIYAIVDMRRTNRRLPPNNSTPGVPKKNWAKGFPAKSILALLVITFFYISIVNYPQLKDEQYAANYFSFMPFKATLESKKWLHSDSLGCTYAIVTLHDAAPLEPPKQWTEDITWNKTPLMFKDKTKAGNCRNLICNCAENWSHSNYQKLTKVLNQPGSYYYLEGRTPPHDQINQAVILIYSKPEQIAAMVRFGD